MILLHLKIFLTLTHNYYELSQSEDEIKITHLLWLM